MTATPRPRIADVAAAAGVSVPTVSKVLNGRTHVSEETRAKVQQALDDLDYSKRTTPAAQPGILQLVVNNFDSPWVLSAMEGVEAAAAHHGYSVAYARAEHVTLDRWRKLREPSVNRLDGVLLLAPRSGSQLVSMVRSLRIPAVAIDPEGTEDLAIPSVSPASFSGALAAVGHLLSHGHRRIGIITGRKHSPGHGRARYAAYAAALHDAGLPVLPELVRDGDFSIESGMQLGADLLDLPQRPTAIFTGSDLQAIGVMNAAAQRNLRVPEDLSIVGFDDIPQAARTSPPLTTVRQPLARMATMAVGMLTERQGVPATAAPTALEVATELVIRKSTASTPA
ncbi:LacI family DNA-binding transcriptional regulator [Pseudarthrobacter sp. J64]|uniref:LacI family DNA-binding transcriptional regulator n=1 Tax=Pseudarthrobacter sp. J64 TaxID=3116485 RepID=UPI002E80C432|nr:LacI family DNA-binding transcriptional regulator [Pseudarthrobacter sp. J64]MEE2568934.1 LacI family DNA-binding transcriptional regulator [Pseudarthrobacter sp. J64]